MEKKEEEKVLRKKRGRPSMGFSPETQRAKKHRKREKKSEKFRMKIAYASALAKVRKEEKSMLIGTASGATLGPGGAVMFRSVQIDEFCFDFAVKYTRVTKDSTLFKTLLAVRQSADHIHLAIPKAVDMVDDPAGQIIVEVYKKYEKTLDKAISEGLTMENSFLYYAGIIKALSALHEMGFTHNDLKPANIAISKTNILKLIDYGSTEVDTKRRISKIGNPYYDTNKSMRRQAHEVFAATNILAEMLTGSPIDCSTKKSEKESTVSVLASLRAKYHDQNLLNLFEIILEKKRPFDTAHILKHPLLGNALKAHKSV